MSSSSTPLQAIPLPAPQPVLMPVPVESIPKKQQAKKSSLGKRKNLTGWPGSKKEVKKKSRFDRLDTVTLMQHFAVIQAELKKQLSPQSKNTMFQIKFDLKIPDSSIFFEKTEDTASPSKKREKTRSTRCAVIQSLKDDDHEKAGEIFLMLVAEGSQSLFEKTKKLEKKEAKSIRQTAGAFRDAICKGKYYYSQKNKLYFSKVSYGNNKIPLNDFFTNLGYKEEIEAVYFKDGGRFLSDAKLIGEKDLQELQKKLNIEPRRATDEKRKPRATREKKQEYSEQKAVKQHRFSNESDILRQHVATLQAELKQSFVSFASGKFTMDFDLEKQGFFVCFSSGDFKERKEISIENLPVSAETESKTVLEFKGTGDMADDAELGLPPLVDVPVLSESAPVAAAVGVVDSSDRASGSLFSFFSSNSGSINDPDEALFLPPFGLFVDVVNGSGFDFTPQNSP